MNANRLHKVALRCLSHSYFFPHLLRLISVHSDFLPFRMFGERTQSIEQHTNLVLGFARRGNKNGLESVYSVRLFLPQRLVALYSAWSVQPNCYFRPGAACWSRAPMHPSERRFAAAQSANGAAG